MATRTHTNYFSEESLAPIRQEFEVLAKSLSDRRPFMDELAYRAGAKRLQVIRNGIDMLAEPVPPSFGG